MHCDARADKMLIDRIEGHGIYFKMGNFGHARFLSEDGLIKYADYSIKETTNYTAPELVKGQDFDEKVDVWSATVLIYMCFQLEMPFSGGQHLKREIVSKELDFDKSMKWQQQCKWHHVSDLAIDFLKMGFSKEPAERPSCLELLRHPWITQGL